MIIRAVLDIETGNWDEVVHVPYVGPWARCDRAASNAAKSAAGTAKDVAGAAGSNASAERAQLSPFYRQEMNATHGFTPEQTNELLGYAGATAGGTGATAMGEANSEVARTRNTSGFSSALDANARDRQKAMGEANLGVGAADIAGAKTLNQEGAAGEAGLFGADTDAQLKAMGIETGDINAQTEAGKSGWYQNMIAGVNAFKPSVSINR